MIIGERDNYRMLAVSASAMQTQIKGKGLSSLRMVNPNPDVLQLDLRSKTV